MNRSRLKKAFLTLPGHMVGLGGPFFMAETAFLVQQAYEQHSLSWAAAVRITAATLTGGAIGGAIMWFCFTRPLIRRDIKEKHRKRSQS